VSAARFAAVALTALLACALLAVPANAAIFKPTRFDDPVPNGCRLHNCSLREAFLASMKREGHDTIPLRGGRYEMELPYNQGSGEDGRWWGFDVTILGKGPKKTTLDANGLDGVLQLGNDQEPNSIQGVKVTGGGTGLLVVGGKNVVKHVVLTDNHTPSGAGGGARLEPRKKVLFTDSKVVGNSAGSGGGLYVAAGSAGKTRATISDSTIRDNESTFGGGIYNHVLDMKVLRTTISGNEATEGGGMDLVSYGNNLSNPRPTTGIFASTISANTASKGGGILADGNQPAIGQLKQIVTVQNSTVVGNETVAEGGGIMADNGVDVNLNYATVAYNTADSNNMGGGVGGGVHQHSGAVFGLANSIVAKNVVGSTGTGAQCDGAFEPSAGGVIEAQPTGTCTIPGANFGVVDALIGTLGDNGGPTETIKLLAGSPAIGSGHEGCPRKDQRGVKRPAEDCDSGAFERKKP
jgi:fibronectin-binding autotransporter adhesin